ncbi:LacI family DNA-binding transcriptional regulator [Saliterribacillus persicus]|uniref:LacI family transcriptional regulator n=1 Tax=Saliterribacillus persicus TaxID=930114 RepID=A0A368YAJ0_9BACI|nr:LacI family DNA-binding transcriptional regulator [Saliterribacillus persicus]RCW77263.1 LacI family transcriptional regulator [Saliterribacillus persicus]
MRVTAKMIAKELGISTATVDRVLNNRKGVADRTIRKVKEKADEMGYKPNKAAKFLSTQKTLKVLFLLPVVPYYFWDEIEQEIKNVRQLYEDFGFRVKVKRVDTIQGNDQLKYFKKVVQEESFDAIVIAPHDADPFVDIINKGVETGIPIFTLNNDVPNSRRKAYVGSDYFDAGYLAAELIHLCQRKLNTVTLIREKEDTYQMIYKEKGFRQFFSDHKLNPEIQIAGIDSTKVDKCMDKEILKIQKTDGIYVANGILGEVADYMRKKDVSNNQVLIGHDINYFIDSFIQTGTISAAICQDPVTQASVAVKKVFDYLYGDIKGELTDTIVKLEIVTKSNAKYYLNEKYAPKFNKNKSAVKSGVTGNGVTFIN